MKEKKPQEQIILLDIIRTEPLKKIPWLVIASAFQTDLVWFIWEQDEANYE